MKARLYKEVKSREDIESSQLFNTMLQKVEGKNSVLIDGKNLMAESIYAKHIRSQQIVADHLAADAITANLIKSGGLELSEMLKLTSGGKDVLYVDSKGELKLNVNSISINMKSVEDELDKKASKGEIDDVNSNLSQVDKDRIALEKELRDTEAKLAQAQKDLSGIEFSSRNYILNGGEKVNFSSQSNIETINPSFINENLIVGENNNFGFEYPNWEEVEKDNKNWEEWVNK